MPTEPGFLAVSAGAPARAVRLLVSGRGWAGGSISWRDTRGAEKERVPGSTSASNARGQKLDFLSPVTRALSDRHLEGRSRLLGCPPSLGARTGRGRGWARRLAAVPPRRAEQRPRPLHSWPVLARSGRGRGRRSSEPPCLHRPLRGGLSHWHRVRAARGSQTPVRVTRKLHTHTWTRTRAVPCAHACGPVCTHTRTCTCVLGHAFARTHISPHTCVRVQRPGSAHVPAHTCACLHTHVHTLLRVLLGRLGGPAACPECSVSARPPLR